MKKILVGVAIAAALVMIAAPFVNGLVMEKVVRKSCEDANNMYSESGSDMSLEIVRYDRGYSSSEIEWKVSLGNMKTVYGVEEIILLDRADHKMFGIESRTSLEKNEWYTELINNRLAGKNPLAMITEFKLSGKIISNITLDGFTAQVEDRVWEVRPGKIITTADNGLTNVVSTMTWQGLTADKEMQVKDVSVSTDLKKITSYIWDGSISWRVARFRAEDKSGVFDANNMQGTYTLSYDRDSDSLSIEVEAGADNMLGARGAVEKPFARFTVNNLDGRGYEEYMKVYTGMANTLIDGIEAEQSDSETMDEVIKRQMASTGIQMVAASEKMLKKGLEIRVTDLFAKVPSGEIKGDLHFSLNQDLTFMQLMPLASQPDLAFQLFSLKSALRFPADMVENRANLVSPVYPGMQTGFFEERDGQLIHEAETRNGKLYLNGSEVTLN